jgi:hypothetical protein
VCRKCVCLCVPAQEARPHDEDQALAIYICIVCTIDGVLCPQGNTRVNARENLSTVLEALAGRPQSNLRLALKCLMDI